MECRNVVVVGAGTMGRGIAHVAALAGYQTWLADVDESTLQKSLTEIEHDLAAAVAREKISEVQRSAALSRLELASDLNSVVPTCDLVIEAVPERMALKQEIFSSISNQVADHSILATNTSSLSVSEIASSSRLPERVIGMHFFNPPHKVRLLEIIRADQTSEQVIEAVRQIGVRMNSPGFASSRLGIALGMEAIRMVEQGVAAPEDIDTAMVHGYRHPIGPLRLGDLVGLDVRLAVGDYLCRELGEEQFRPPALLRQMVTEGKLGRKSGEGFYIWTN
ncbi:MAG: 3-hydroxyacyl-CoA dehydrogenase family protein [SAR202 cluster bacterium]|nr:MAG: 3-hydroxyacyl-CoA dehydrogenase family protein [SAR202 cluster bacterium]